MRFTLLFLSACSMDSALTPQPKDHADAPSGSTDAQADTAQEVDTVTPPDSVDTAVVTDPGETEQAPAPTCTAFPGALVVPIVYPTIGEALLAAVDGDTVCVEAGTYVENLDLRGVDVHVVGVAGADATFVDGSGLGSVLRATRGESATIEGLTLQGGYASDGAGIEVIGASLTLIDLVVRDSTATRAGGGVHIEGGSISATNVDLLDNHSLESGGGAFIEDARVEWSGGIASGNHVDGYEGGAFLFYEGASGSLVGTDVRDNHADPAGGGTGGGGGLFIYHTSPLLVRNVVFAGNTSLGGRGGAFYIYDDTDAVFENVTVAGNLALNGGGAFLCCSSDVVTLRNVVFAANRASDEADNLWVYSGDIALSWSDLVGAGYEGIDTSVGSDGNVAVDPGFIAFAPGGDPWLWDFHLAAGSALADAGAPTITDSDGSPSDIGAYGGSAGDAAWYDDVDADGLPDGWELDHALDPSVDDASDDVDFDGLDALGELGAGTDPHRADTDGDGRLDGVEVADGSDPLVA